MTENILRHLLEAVFYALIPITALFFRYKKKITTGFAIGIILSSLALGLISIATAARNDPVPAFIKEVNLKNYDAAKRNYKLAIQHGAEYLNRINKAEIIDLSFFEKIKKDTAAEYIKIAEDSYESCTFDNGTVSETDIEKLKHALKLLSMSESIGRPHHELKAKITQRIADAE